MPKVIIRCEICAKNFTVQRSQLKHRNPKYCSRECMGKGMAKPDAYIDLPCEHCGKVTRKLKSHLKAHSYCSTECASNATKIDNAKWRDPEYIKAYMRNYYSTNADTHKQASVEWHRRNPEYKKLWEAENPEKVKASHYRHRGRKSSLPNNFTHSDMEFMLDYWQGRCAYCDKQQGLLSGFELTIDHFIPLSNPKCTGTIRTNLLPACKSCNSRKNAKDPIEWLISKLGKRKAEKKLADIQAYFDEVAA